MRIPRVLEDPSWPGHFNSLVVIVACATVGAVWGVFMTRVAHALDLNNLVAIIVTLPLPLAAEYFILTTRFARRRRDVRAASYTGAADGLVRQPD